MIRHSARLGVLAWLVLGLTAALAAADGFIVIKDPPPIRPPRPPQPRPEHYRFAPLEVSYHHVTTKIVDQVAVTEVDQSFHNPNNQRLEGTYLFPIPVGAQIDKFAMDIDGKPVDAELLDADKARGIYEDIVRKARDPALMEYVGQGLFKVRIFPIEPLSEKRIQLKYTQLLPADGGMVQYLYPLNTEKFSAAPLGSVSIKVELECRRALRSIYSPSHPVEIQRHGDNRAVVGYEARDVKPDADFQLIFATDDADVGLSLLTYNDGTDAGGGYFLLLASPSGQMKGEQIIAKDVIFVLDTSGSMADNDKLDQAKKTLRFCLKNLNEHDRFDVIRFSTETQPLFDQLSVADGPNLLRAEKFIDGLKPIGGTAIADALLAALKSAAAPKPDRPCYVVFLTDGQPTVGESNEDRIVAAVGDALGGRAVRVFCFGVGTDVNTHLLDRIASRTRAASQYVLPEEDIEVKVSSFYAKINQPVLADLELKVGGDVRLSEIYPAALPDLFQGEQLVVFGRYTGAGATAVTLAGSVNGRSRSFSYDARFAARADEHAFIPRLWAVRRVGYLLDQIRLNGESRELRDEIAALARQYGIVTPYTAFLIVEDEAQRNVPPQRRTLQTVGRSSGARMSAGRVYKEAGAARSGGGAVGDSQAIDDLSRATTPAAPAVASGRAFRGRSAGGQGGAATTQPGLDELRETLAAQLTRFIRGRTFYLNGEQWIDAQIQSRPDARRVSVRFNSDGYFELLARHPYAAQWLSVGQNVQLLLDDVIYEIAE